MSIRTRLDRLHRRLPARPRSTEESRPASQMLELDSMLERLTSRQVYEFDQLLAKVDDAPRLANGQGDFSVLSLFEEKMLDDLCRIMAGGDGSC